MSYLYITKAINIYDLSRGFDSLEQALLNVQAETYLISFKDDMLFLSDEMKTIADKLAERTTLKSDYLEVDSNYGHDAFLVELDKFEDYVKKALHE